MNRKKAWISVILVLMLMISSCSKNETKSTGVKFNKNEKVTLKVLYFNDQAFYAQYGSMFQAKYPNVDFEVISTMGNIGEDKDPAKEFDKLVEENNPDIILMTADQYEKQSASGKLYALDTIIQQDNFDIENMVPGVIEYLKSKGGGKLYGLSPSFSTKALFYNKDLFDAQGIPYPTDKMSWEAVLELANRFPSTGTDKTRVYGLAQSMFTSNPFDLVQTIAQSKQWSYLDLDGKNLTMDTPEWKSLFEQVIKVYQDKSVSLSGNSMNATVAMPAASVGAASFIAPEDSNLFIAGRAAMIIEGSYLINQIDMMKNMKMESKLVNWGVVTEPVDSTNPDVSDSFDISQIFGINAKSDHLGAAWEFVKYLHSEEMAKIRSKSSQELITRNAYAMDKTGLSLEAFYALKPNNNAITQKYPKGFRAAFSKITSEETKAAISKTKSLDEALAAIKDKGQKALVEANLSGEMEEENTMMMGGITTMLSN